MYKCNVCVKLTLDLVLNVSRYFRVFGEVEYYLIIVTPHRILLCVQALGLVK